MKILKKLNLGLVLTIIVVLALVIYLVVQNGQRTNAKTEILKVCEGYIELTDKFAVLPESAQVLGEDAKTVNLDEYKKNLKSDLEKISSNDTVVEINGTILTDVVKKDLLNTNVITTKFDRKITKLRSFEFNGNTVTVTFDSKVHVTQKYAKIDPVTGSVSEESKENSFEVQRETVSLEKKDNNWKVVTANIAFSDPQNGANTDVVSIGL